MNIEGTQEANPQSGSTQQGLKRTVVATVNDKVEEKIAALSEKFPDARFYVQDHDTRKQIWVEQTESLTPTLMQDMRDVCRNVV